MTLMPGSNQYVAGPTPLRTVIAYALLPAANAETAGEVICVGYGRVTLLCQYAPNDVGEQEVDLEGTGVIITLYLSPYIDDSQIPAGESEWWPVTVIQTEDVDGCSINGPDAEWAEITYCHVDDDDNIEPFTLDFSLPSHAQRIRVEARELETGEEAGPGTFGCMALFSNDPGGEFGWTLKNPPGTVAIAGAVAVTGTVDANVQIGDVDASATNPVPSIIIPDCVTTVTSTEASSGDNEVVAAPGADYQIIVWAFSFQNTTAVATTGILRAGATANGWAALCQNQGDGHRMVFQDGHPWCLGENLALNLNLDGANTFNCSVMYEVVAG